MLCKNYLEKIFNKAYFKLLFRRHMSLCIIPLVIFICLMILVNGIFGYDTEALVLFLIPYAVAIVPITALIMFKPLTKKGDASHLMSIPITRTQNFVTTYLVGLVLIEISLFIMSSISGFTTYFNERIIIVFTFVMLGIIYYTFACLGCMIGGQTIMQFLMMGVICFGPVALYLLNWLSISSIAFGEYTTSINDSLVMVFCPLYSAAEFLTGGYWPYGWAHMIIVIVAFVLCVYLMNKRPLEQTQQGVLFKNVEKWLIKPIIYLNIVYVVFNVLISAMNIETYYFNTQYYLGIMIALLGSSLLVSFLMSVWTSKDVGSLFKWKEIMYHLLLVGLSSILLIIPLYQTEQHRYSDLLHEGNYVRLAIPFNYEMYEVSMSKEELLPILEVADQYRENFLINAYKSGDDDIFTLTINYDQRYYFRSNMSGMYELIEKVILENRVQETWLNKIDAIYLNGEVYQSESIVKTIEDLNQNQISGQTVSHLASPNIYLDDGWTPMLAYYYPLSLPQIEYHEWIQHIQEAAIKVYDEKEWTLIEAAVDFENAKKTDRVKAFEDKLEILYQTTSDNWEILEATENHLVMYVDIDFEAYEDYEDENVTFFDYSAPRIKFLVTLDKVDGKWQALFDVNPDEMEVYNG